MTYTLSHWGTYKVEQRDVGPPAILPFERDPDPSPIGLHQNAPSLARLRVRRPAIRRSWLESGPGSATDLRGTDEFVEVDWQQALDLAAAEINRVRSLHGNKAIFGGSYGWSSAGRFHHAQSQVHRFLNATGGYVRHVDSYSLGAANVLLPHVVAPMDELMASHSSWDTLARHTGLFVTFGGIPVKNAQMNAGGVGLHLASAGLRAMADAGVRIVNIGPVGDNMGPVEDRTQWIRCRPNTDTAVMMAMAHVLISERLHDHEFLHRCCVGFAVIERYILGHDDGVAKTPAWAEAISAVPAAVIASLARDMAATRTMLNVSWAMQRASHGEQPYWMVVTLASLLGHIGKPGGGFGVGYGAANLVGSSHRRIKGPTFPQGQNGVKDFIPVARIADMLLNPEGTFRYNGVNHHYPDIKLVYWAGGNPFHHHQDLTRLQQAWTRPDTVIVNESYWTATARRADIVLPATVTLERDDIGSATLEGFFVAMKRAQPAADEARDDYFIFAELAERLGCGEIFTEGLDTMGWLRRMYDESRRVNKERGIDLPAFEVFWEAGLLDLTAYDRPVTMLGSFVADPAANPLGTPSGLIELYSQTIAGFDLADCPGHAAWLEPAEWLGAEEAELHPLHLLTDQPARRLHSQLDASPYSAEGKIDGREIVYIHPLDAKARGIATGDVVELFNDRGRCLASAHLSDKVMEGVLRLNTGAWYNPEPGTGRDLHGNPNVLTADRPASSLSQGCAAQSCLVDIVGHPADVPRVSAFDLPSITEQTR